MKHVIHWFRRDLRLFDNHALAMATQSGLSCQCIFIFDEDILSELEINDHRVNYIYDQLNKMQKDLESYGSSLNIYRGKVLDVWNEILVKSPPEAVFSNEDYEPYAIQRDSKVEELLNKNGIELRLFQDHVIMAKDRILKADGKPYTVFTPFKKKYLELLEEKDLEEKVVESDGFIKTKAHFPKAEEIGIMKSSIPSPILDLENIHDYDSLRDRPDLDKTSYVGTALRFGSISIRKLMRKAEKENATYHSELIWREFFSQILWHFPRVVEHSFKPAYDNIQWRNDPDEYEKWCKGQTGFPMVDAGMRQLNETGFMHNRVRMLCASFLCKHLLIDWRWGEAYFAEKLFDFDLASNNGNWQWAAGCGCDAAPYFRVFSPYSQREKFDPKGDYCRRWIPELDSLDYPREMVDHKMARQRALDTYKKALN